MRLGLGMGFVKNRNRGFVNRFYTFFNGIDEYITCGKKREFDPKDKISFFAIFKNTPFDSADNRKIFTLYADDGNRIFLNSPHQGNLDIVLIINSGTFKIINIDKPTDTEWHSIVINIDGNNIDIYLDNMDTPKVTTTLPNSITEWDTTNASLLNIGSYSSASYLYSGIIDEFGYWNGKILSKTERSVLHRLITLKTGDISKIQGLTCGYHLGDKASWDGLQWKFPDLSGNGNDGTSQGMDESNVRRY